MWLLLVLSNHYEILELYTSDAKYAYRRDGVVFTLKSDSSEER